MTERVIVANRGEIAIRVMQACTALGHDVVGVYTPEDNQSLHVDFARKNSSLGGKGIWCVGDYASLDDILQVADFTGCTAFHPGYGYLSEDPRAARRITYPFHAPKGYPQRKGLRFIGPHHEHIKLLGNKLAMKRLASALGVPVIPGTLNEILNETEAEDAVHETGLPVLIKATAGGGGRGITLVEHANEIRRRFRAARRDARDYFKNDSVLIEKYFTDFQHIEVQLVCDAAHDTYVHWGTRNCTVQTPWRQKRIEVGPGFDPDYKYPYDAHKIEERILRHSKELAGHIGYNTLVTFEWLVTNSGDFYLMEANTRFQVEGFVSGNIVSIGGERRNLLQEQIALAYGRPLRYTQQDITLNGFCIEYRIVAEDTDNGFRPWAGTITRFEVPAHNWLEVYSHIPRDKPYVIPAKTDPNLALVLVRGKTLEEAKNLGVRALKETVIEGKAASGEPIKMNIPYLIARTPRLLHL